MLFRLSVPGNNERHPKYIRDFLDLLHAANEDRRPVTLSYARYQHAVALCCRVPPELQSLAAHDLPSFFDGCEIMRMPEDALDPSAELTAWSCELRLRPDIFPLPADRQYEDLLKREFVDPIIAVLSRVADRRFHSRVDLTLRPATLRRCRQARRIRDAIDPLLPSHRDLAHWLARAFTCHRPSVRWSFLLLRMLLWRPFQSCLEPDTADKVRKHNLYEAELRLFVAAERDDVLSAWQQLRSLAGAFAPFSQGQLVTWERSRIWRHRRDPSLLRGRGFLLSSEDVARLWHPVTKTVNAPALSVTECRRLEPTPDFGLREKRAGDMLLGRTTFRDEGHPVRLSLPDRLRHVLMIGRTGTGKSTLMENMFCAEMQAGNGCCLIDPHGDLCEAVQTLVPSQRIGDVISFDVASRHHPPGFNILDCPDPDRFALVADGGVSAFKKVFGLSEAETPRLISILRNSLLTLVEMPGTTLLDIGRLLTEEPYRAKAIRGVKNPVVKAYWVQRFGRWTRSERTKAVEAVLNKVDSFATTPLLQRIVGQPRNGLDFRRAMDKGRIVLINLSKGRVGEDAANMLGSLLVTQLQLDAMSRADLPPHDRRPFFLYIDEFQNFATESFPAILSEARKFGLGLIAAHQYLDQVPRETAKAVFGNVGTLVSFQVGADDAELLARQFSREKGDVEERDLINLPRYHAMVRLLVDGMPTRRFTMETCAPPVRSQRATADALSSLSPRVKVNAPAVAATTTASLTKTPSSSRPLPVR